jgi:uncharacterized tellurite resistance protein B-like protein
LFGRRPKSKSSGADALESVVREHMSDADDATVQIVAAIAGLLGGIAYADRRVLPEEERRLRAELSRMHALSEAGVDEICKLLSSHTVEIATTQAPRYTRALREHADRELRLEVLETLVELAASDGRITLDEVNVLRNTATALGLTQDDYNAAQAKHRDKLSFL